LPGDAQCSRNIKTSVDEVGELGVNLANEIGQRINSFAVLSAALASLFKCKAQQTLEELINNLEEPGMISEFERRRSGLFTIRCEWPMRHGRGTPIKPAVKRQKH